MKNYRKESYYTDVNFLVDKTQYIKEFLLDYSKSILNNLFLKQNTFKSFRNKLIPSILIQAHRNTTEIIF